jgi:hypothetical protein
VFKFGCFGFLFWSLLVHGAIRVEEVESWAFHHPQAKVEDFLNWVKIKDPSQMSWFTLMRQSESAQGASSLNPRAIVFGPESKFIFTFNGEAAQTGFQEVEMIFFREFPEAKWELRKLSFDSKNLKVQFSDANPPSCVSCHYNPVRPIWSQYDIWKGAYGENDDAILDFDHDKYAGTSLDDSAILVRKKEFSDYQKFLENSKTHPRYSTLQFPEGSPVTPFGTESRNFNYRFRPNLRLTESLIGLHAKTLLARLKSHPQYQKEAPFLLAMLMGCENYVQNEMAKKLLSTLEEQFQKVKAETVPWNRKGYEGEKSPNGHLMHLLGVENAEFSLEKIPTRWAYFGGALYSDENLMMELYSDLKSRVSTLPQVKYIDHYNTEHLLTGESGGDTQAVPEFCEVLISLRSKEGAFEAAIPKPLSEATLTCLGCHDRGGSAPFIPFGNHELMKKDSDWVQKIKERVLTEDQRKKMPPTRPLTQKEKFGILEWLSQF